MRNRGINKIEPEVNLKHNIQFFFGNVVQEIKLSQNVFYMNSGSYI